MRALIEERASPFASPTGPPVAAVVVFLGSKPGGDNPVDSADFPQFPRVEQVMQLFIGGAGAQLKHHAELQAAVGPVRLNHLQCILFVDGHRLVAHHMDSGSKGINGDGRMGIVGCGDDDGIHQAGCEHRLVVIEGRHLEESRRTVSRIRANVAYGGHLIVFRTPGGTPVAGSHDPRANDSKTNLIHGLPSLCIIPATLHFRGLAEGERAVHRSF